MWCTNILLWEMGLPYAETPPFLSPKALVQEFDCILIHSDCLFYCLALACQDIFKTHRLIIENLNKCVNHKFPI